VLVIHRATRADRLADALGSLLHAPLPDPLAPDLVAVPTRGMERWLTQHLSAALGASPDRADGVCANVLFPSPHDLVTGAVAAASGVAPDRDPWRPERSVWQLLEVVDACLGEPWLAGLSHYLGATSTPPDPVRQTRRLSVVRHLAGLLDRYALHRPEMLEAWARGEGWPGSDSWQAELWRRLSARIGTEGPAQRRARACAALRDEPGILDLPDRLSLFGLTRLPAGHLQILRALATRRDVHLFLLHPSPALWTSVSDHMRHSPSSLRRADDRTAGLPRNRLLASWGRDSREMQVVLQEGGHADLDHDHDHDSVPAARTLLGALQDDIRADRAPPGVPLPGRPDARPLLDPDDRGIEIHSCHGRGRQVEVMRDAILHVLAQDDTLEPRDVIVMCPDIETFAPLIQATFGAGEPRELDGVDPLPRHRRPIDLRVRLADRSLRQTNPVLGVVSQLFELVGQRLTASQVLDLADRGPVRRRFGFDDDDLTRLQDWISQAGIRWGLDAGHRAPFKLEAVQEGTWRTGLDRLLLGVTMTEDEQRQFAGVLPLDDVDSRSIDLVGRFTELMARLGESLDGLGERQALPDWAHTIARSADALSATGGRDRWQRLELQRVLDEMVAEAGDETPSRLAPAEVRALLSERLAGRPTRANFRTGHLTVCTLLPMRSVPHRVVCLLGLDDGAFPRKASRDGDDLMLDDPHIGERDPRSEDRQLLLDALLAAGERLIITYTGNDERTNTLRPPAVPVGELLDAIDATVRREAGPARDRVVVRHPLQPFDPLNFTPGALGGAPPWSFDPVTLEGARALLRPRSAARGFLAVPLSPRGGRVVELEDLVRFVEHPVRAFLRQRLGIILRSSDDEIADGLPVELDGLERWGVGQRLLEARLRGVDGRAAILAEKARGTLPPGVLGLPVVNQLYPIVDAIVDQAQAAVPGTAQPDPVDVRVALPDGRLLNGTVAGVTDDVLLTTSFSRVSAKHRLAAWVRFLALNASVPERPFSAVTIGRGSRRDDVRVAVLPPLAATRDERRTAALEELTRLVDLFDRGMCEPLPIFCKTSAAYASAVAAGQDPRDAAGKDWTSNYKLELEDRELEHQLVLGAVLSLEELLAFAPRPGETGAAWADGEDTRLGRLARRLWDGLLAHEQVSAR
jgi:exodeoxyribonuclease V gamma subunit